MIKLLRVSKYIIIIFLCCKDCMGIGGGSDSSCCSAMWYSPMDRMTECGSSVKKAVSNPYTLQER